MHGSLKLASEAPVSTPTMVVDPVCQMTIDPATAAAKELSDGKVVYFCSEGCRRRFLANPAAYASATAVEETDHQCCAVSNEGESPARLLTSVPVPIAAGMLACAILLGMYFGALTAISGWDFAVEQFAEWWPYIITLAAGFGLQVGLFVYLRRAVRRAASAKVLVATGTTSGAAMLACCTHYLVNLLPVLGATGLMSFVGAYQVELFWFGIASNLAGILYIGRRVARFLYGV